MWKIRQLPNKNRKMHFFSYFWALKIAYQTRICLSKRRYRTRFWLSKPLTGHEFGSQNPLPNENLATKYSYRAWFFLLEKYIIILIIHEVGWGWVQNWLCNINTLPRPWTMSARLRRGVSLLYCLYNLWRQRHTRGWEWYIIIRSGTKTDIGFKIIQNFISGKVVWTKNIDKIKSCPVRIFDGSFHNI